MTYQNIGNTSLRLVHPLEDCIPLLLAAAVVNPECNFAWYSSCCSQAHEPTGKGNQLLGLDVVLPCNVRTVTEIGMRAKMISGSIWRLRLLYKVWHTAVRAGFGN